eukprot:gb/GEZJ01006414.1/.p1 GENE.gb/GEZJ01006414.1/~~gb/GEZJ01006414.1/.p1  ORF type:complete len:625 (-),score=-1.86 gb/GEZJ01006414.1/:367-2241(-)
MNPVTLAILTALVARICAARSWRPGVSIPPNQLVTSPLSCVRHSECSPDQYCKFPNYSVDDDPAAYYHREPVQRISTCVPRLQEGAFCGLSICAEGLVCSSDGIPAPPSCARRLPLGAKCPSLGQRCSEGLKCQTDGEAMGETKCLPFTSGFEGDSCERFSSCQVPQGFYCNEHLRQCAARKPHGAICGADRSADGDLSAHECEGFCVGSIFSSSTTGVCHRLQKVGEKCDSDFQCKTLLFGFLIPRSADLLCNAPSGYTGVCVLETDLIRELGAPCNPANDTCDAVRGLSCGRVHHDFKCVQRGTGKNNFPYCTPNSPLSSCPPGPFGVLRECRRGLTLNKEFDGMYGCRTRREVVPLGTLCGETEHIICQPGAVCAVPNGVESNIFFTATCMKVLPDGAPCSDPLRFKCEEGSFCMDGSCQRMESPPNVQISVACTGCDCTELSCAAGQVCEKRDGISEDPKVCQLPIVDVGLWRPCRSSLFRLKCKAGLHCSPNVLGNGLDLCRPKRGFGQLCQTDDSCIRDFKCLSPFQSSTDGPIEKRCYNASLPLGVGEPCNPSSRRGEPICVASSCLPKNGSYVCQRPAGLFQHCSTKENIGCQSSDLVCSEMNACLPVSQRENPKY